MAARLRILHSMRAPVGGLFRHVLDLAGAQAERGHDVGIIADATTGDGLTAARLAAIEPKLTLGIKRVAMVRQPGLGDIAALRAVLTHARALDVDVLHGHGAKGGAYARIAAAALRSQKARGSRRPACFYTPHGGSLNYKPGTFAASVFLKLEAALRPATQGLIFESAFAERAYAASIGLGRVPVRVIPNGLAPQDFTPVPLDEGAADFLFIGELRDVKGVDVLLLALAALDRGRAVIVGAGPSEQNLKALARDLRLEDRAVFAGAMPARDAMKLGRALVVPSRAESFPYVVLEAAAAQRPLIATNVGGIPEIVAKSDTALVPAGDAAALAKAMATYLADPAAADAKAERLRAIVARKFTVAAMADAVLKFYTEILDKWPARVSLMATAGSELPTATVQDQAPITLPRWRNRLATVRNSECRSSR